MCKRVKRICQYCGKEFEVQEWVVKKGGGKFCSRKCDRLSRQKRVKKICMICGREFVTHENAVKKGYGKFCSRECYWKYRQRREKRICQVCGKEFEALECAVKKGGGKFCSKECERLGKQKRVKRICQVCGKEFEALECVVKKGRGKLCSKECFRKYMEGEEYKGKLSRKMKDLWRTLEYREKTVKNMMANVGLKPNRLEKMFCDLLQSYFLGEWRYVGDGKIFIAGFVPDFIHKQEKWVIELNGDYWHSFPEAREKDKRKKKEYEKYGYKVLEVWESEFRANPMVVVDKIVKTFY
jgi:very-short-patch-repair endonuclease